MVAASWVWGAIALAQLGAVGVGPARVGEPEPPARERSSIAGGWLQLAPLGFGVPGPGKGEDLRVLDRAVVAGYRWGVSAGLSFEPVEHLFVNASGSLDQTIWVFDNDDRSYELCYRNDCHGWTERGFGHLIRLGPTLRLGWTSRHLLAWAALAVHVGLGRMRLDCDNSVEEHCDLAETDLGPGLGGGLGLALRPIPSFALGLESSIDHTWLDRRDDPFRAARTWSLALVTVVSF